MTYRAEPGSKTNQVLFAGMAVLLLSAMVGCGGGTIPTRSADGEFPEGSLGASNIRQLTGDQFRNSIRDVFGADIRVTTELDPDVTDQVFSSVGAASAVIGGLAAEKYIDASLEIAEQVVGKLDDYQAWQGCTLSSATAPCIADGLASFGRRLWRRPLRPVELDRIGQIVALAKSEGGEIAEGLKYAIAALLQSPHFLYLVEVGENPADEQTPLTPYETAARLSFLIWNSVPDEELLTAAKDGNLSTARDARTQAERMLIDTRGHRVLSRLLGEAWNLPRLQRIQDTELAEKYRTEFGMVLEHIVANDRWVHEVLTARETFVDADLAAVYGIGDVDATGGEFVRASLPEERMGLLTSGAVLASNAAPPFNSLIYRGVFVYERLLCEHLGSSPPGAADLFDPPEDETPAGARAFSQARQDSASCSGCHSVIDPIGFAFERFDDLGAVRSGDVDTSGSFEGAAISSPADLVVALEGDPRFDACLALNFYTFWNGHFPNTGERLISNQMAQTMVATGSFRDLVINTVEHSAFRTLVKDAVDQ